MNLVAAVLLHLLSPALAADDVGLAVAALSPREPTMDCTTLVSRLVDPVATLAQVVESREAPPWLPMRAASCLTPLPHADRWLRVWVARDGFAGIADVVLSHLDALPRPLALDLTRTALAGPLRDAALVRVRTSAVPEIAALGRP